MSGPRFNSHGPMFNSHGPAAECCCGVNCNVICPDAPRRVRLAFSGLTMCGCTDFTVFAGDFSQSLTGTLNGAVYDLDLISDPGDGCIWQKLDVAPPVTGKLFSGYGCDAGSQLEVYGRLRVQIDAIFGQIVAQLIPPDASIYGTPVALFTASTSPLWCESRTVKTYSNALAACDGYQLATGGTVQVTPL
jgi:hypothetical protein